MIYDVSAARPFDLEHGGAAAVVGLSVTAITSLIVSAFGRPLGGPTFGLGVTATVIALVRRREPPWATLRRISWSALLLVAGLFVMVSAVEQTGLTSALETRLRTTSRVNGATGAAAIATGIALVSDVLNNLPAGWLASAAVSEAHPPKDVVEPLLTGVDLGANLSITGSLATLLWLTALRREGIAVGFWRFLKVGRLSRRRR